MATKKKAQKEEAEKPAFTVKKDTVETEKEAIELAMLELDTFEGNLKRLDSKTHYGFSKVRD